MSERTSFDFVYHNGEQGNSLMVETLGGGCGWLDYDCDGHWDAYLCQGGNPTASHTASEPNDVLLRLAADGKFTNVAELARITEQGYSQGVSIGDFDNDGFDDIYVTNVGRNSLFQNLGDGTFQEITVQAGVGDERWSSSSAFADLDHDGDLDLYVCNYCVYDPRQPLECRNAKGEPRICHPRDVEAWPDECYFNQGDGTFTAEARSRGLYGEGNKALGVAVADFNGDGWVDVYVANDTTANFIFISQGDGHFREEAIVRGCAIDRQGAYQASMGLAVGDYDGDGWLDIYSTHFYEESNTLYRNLGAGVFEDVTGILGLHDPTMLRLGFGTVMQDFNQNGWPELFVANGHIENYPNNPLHAMQPQLFEYGGVKWKECTASSGEFFRQKRIGRGVAACDFDNDGGPDLCVVHQNASASLLENASERGSFLVIAFKGHDSNRRGIGCQVTVTVNGRQYTQQLFAGGSYASSHQPYLFFGLGDCSGPGRVEVVWPSKKRQTLESVGLNQKIILDERDGRPNETL
ncbi:MAG: CRTAC1 family protein [Planctomycetales bacterium]|nr:CRTAC1 family protein [Planctomycetales bacterium]